MSGVMLESFLPEFVTCCLSILPGTTHSFGPATTMVHPADIYGHTACCLVLMFIHILRFTVPSETIALFGRSKFIRSSLTCFYGLANLWIIFGNLLMIDERYISVAIILIIMWIFIVSLFLIVVISPNPKGHQKGDGNDNAKRKVDDGIITSKVGGRKGGVVGEDEEIETKGHTRKKESSDDEDHKGRKKLTGEEEERGEVGVGDARGGGGGEEEEEERGEVGVDEVRGGGDEEGEEIKEEERGEDGVEEGRGEGDEGREIKDEEIEEVRVEEVRGEGDEGRETKDEEIEEVRVEEVRGEEEEIAEFGLEEVSAEEEKRAKVGVDEVRGGRDEGGEEIEEEEEERGEVGVEKVRGEGEETKEEERGEVGVEEVRGEAAAEEESEEEEEERAKVGMEMEQEPSPSHDKFPLYNITKDDETKGDHTGKKELRLAGGVGKKRVPPHLLWVYRLPCMLLCLMRYFSDMEMELTNCLLFVSCSLGELTLMMLKFRDSKDIQVVQPAIDVVHKAFLVMELLTAHAMAAELLGEGVVLVCMQEIVAALVWLTIYLGSDDDHTVASAVRTVEAWVHKTERPLIVLFSTVPLGFGVVIAPIDTDIYEAEVAMFDLALSIVSSIVVVHIILPFVCIYVVRQWSRPTVRIEWAIRLLRLFHYGPWTPAIVPTVVAKQLMFLAHKISMYLFG